jgi:hypothetical protein
MKTRKIDSTAEQTLFGKSEMAATAWESFMGTANELKIEPVDACMFFYEKWKRVYKQFRELEHQTLYAADESSKPRIPNEGELRAHRHSISVLVQRGEELALLFDQMASSVQREDDRDAVHNMKIPLGVLMESLREAMELWHPANKAEYPAELAAIFDH